MIVRIHALFRASTHNACLKISEKSEKFNKNWCREGELNSRPHHYQNDGPPVHARAQAGFCSVVGAEKRACSLLVAYATRIMRAKHTPLATHQHPP